MKPIKPATFQSIDLENFFWENISFGREIKQFLLRIGADFPSVVLAYSADLGTDIIAEKLAGEISKLGINVFLSQDAVPISALSLGLVQREMQMGLYLSKKDDNTFRLFPLAAHGGPVDWFEGEDFSLVPRSPNGVVGKTELLEPYVKQLSGLVDTYCEYSKKLSGIDSPFFALENCIRRNEDLKIFYQFETGCPRAIIDSEGQILKIEKIPGEFVPTREIVQTIGKYLIKLRKANGTILCPEGTRQFFKDWGTPFEVSGEALDMSHQATYSDLLLGWWEPGIIAHQGHSPFGDAYLSLAYYLEAINSGQI